MTPPDENSTEPEDTAGAEEAEAEAAEAAVETEAPADPAAEIADLKDRLLRAMAETENVRRRAQRDREDASKYAVANFARDMLKVADDLRRALDSVKSSGEGGDATASLVQGVELTEREMLAALERHGIKRLEPMGEKFSHDFHEAMFEVPTNDHAPGTVVQVIEPGYVIHDRLLRAARVGIAKALPAGDSGGEGPGGSGDDGDGGHAVDTTA